VRNAVTRYNGVIIQPTQLDIVFHLGLLLVAPFWLAMIFAPRSRAVARVIASPFIVAGAALLYLLLLAPNLADILPVLARPSLATIAALLGSPLGATLAWMHFLAFDLFVGRWIFLQNQSRDTNAFLISAILALTFIIGPCGLLVYLGLTSLKKAPGAVPSRP
jgi:hypothetical protein